MKNLGKIGFEKLFDRYGYLECPQDPTLVWGFDPSERCPRMYNFQKIHISKKANVAHFGGTCGCKESRDDPDDINDIREIRKLDYYIADFKDGTDRDFYFKVPKNKWKEMVGE